MRIAGVFFIQGTCSKQGQTDIFPETWTCVKQNTTLMRFFDKMLLFIRIIDIFEKNLINWKGDVPIAASSPRAQPGVV